MAYRIGQKGVFLLAGEVKRRGDEVLYLEDWELTEVLPESFFWIPLPERPATKDF